MGDAETTRTAHAASRTVMAADRTLMAWIRTALSMISFGFTIYKVLQGFQEGGKLLPHSDTPRRLGLFLTGLGTLSILLGTLEYRQTMARIGPPRLIARPVFIIA